VSKRGTSSKLLAVGRICGVKWVEEFIQRVKEDTTEALAAMAEYVQGIHRPRRQTGTTERGGHEDAPGDVARVPVLLLETVRVPERRAMLLVHRGRVKCQSQDDAVGGSNPGGH
jgi:hypothetical protein